MFQRVITLVIVRANAIFRAWSKSDGALVGYLADLARTPEELLTENALVRQQLVVLQRKVGKPKLGVLDRLIMLICARFTRTWQSATLIVEPNTVLRWHREGLRLFWRWKSRKRRDPKQRIAPETIELIRRFAAENRLWGAERIRGELLKVGISVAKRTVQKYMRPARGPRPSGQTWRTFLRNHAGDVWACDFLQTFDICFRPIFAFFIVHLGSRRVVLVNVTYSPTGTWTAQQLRNATPFGAAPRFLIRDNDRKFSTEFDRAARAVGITVLRTPVAAPLANAVCERFLGSVQRECLDHLLILGKRHLCAILAEYVSYFSDCRPHQGLAQRIPSERKPDRRAGSVVVGLPVLSGLHHDYAWAA